MTSVTFWIDFFTRYWPTEDKNYYRNNYQFWAQLLDLKNISIGTERELNEKIKVDLKWNEEDDIDDSIRKCKSLYSLLKLKEDKIRSYLEEFDEEEDYDVLEAYRDKWKDADEMYELMKLLFPENKRYERKINKLWIIKRLIS